MKNDLLDDYDLFYMELPGQPELEDVDITDVIDEPIDTPAQGLSSDQVSRIALDSVEAEANQPQDASQPEVEQLFNN